MAGALRVALVVVSLPRVLEQVLRLATGVTMDDGRPEALDVAVVR